MVVLLAIHFLIFLLLLQQPCQKQKKPAKLRAIFYKAPFIKG